MRKYFQITKLFIFLALAGSCDKAFITEPRQDPVSIFDDLWSTFKEDYALFEERGIDWDEHYAALSPAVHQNLPEDALFDYCTRLLDTLDDGHVTLIAPERNVFFSNKIRQNLIDNDLFDLDLIKENYLEKEYYTNPSQSYVYGKMQTGNIAYIFLDHIGENLAIFSDFLDQFKDTDGLIIDLRHNKGGDFTYAFQAMGRLTDQTRFVFKSKTKNGKGLQDYTNWHSWYLKPSGTYFDKPIAVLTDRYTISAGERTVMALKTLPNVTVIGEPTNGAQGTVIGRELANGWYYTLVLQKTEFSDGKSYEGVGLSPDIPLKNTRLQIKAGRDEVLERSLNYLKEK